LLEKKNGAWNNMKKILKVFVCVLLIATIIGASFSNMVGSGSGAKPPKEDPDPTPADPAIAYIGGSRKDFGLWVMDGDGSHQTHVPITDSVYPDYMSWSPDGSSLALTSRPVNTVNMYLWTMDITVDENGKVQGSNAEKVISDSIRPGYSVWSPNGDVIAYSKATNPLEYPDSPYMIWLYDVSDSTTEKIYTDPDDRLMFLTWNPTGTKLAFIKDAKHLDSTWYPPAIQILDVSAKTVETIYTFPESMYPFYYHGGLDWTNNDDKLAFVLNGNIAIFDLSENDYEILDSGSAVYPTWSPDDSKIAFEGVEVKGEQNIQVIKTIDLSTGELNKLAEGRMPDWCIA
jgi:Tol biopolymer transport system component